MPDPGEPLVVRVMRKFASQLLAREGVQMDEMARRWLSVERSLQEQMDGLAREIADLRAAGETVSRAKLARMARYRSLLAQAQGEIGRYIDYADRTITARQLSFAEMGLNDSARAIEASYQMNYLEASFNRLPVEAVERMAGLAGDGSPLRTLLRQAWPEAADGMTTQLVNAIALGKNPRVTAKAMADGLANGLNRCLTIARTEQLRAYRDATRAQYQQSGVVRGYKRIAAHQSRTCMACLLADGKVVTVSGELGEGAYSLDQHFQMHPQCRCTMVPVVIGMPEIQYRTGLDWFRALPESQQRLQMGDKYFAAWKDGVFDLPQLVGVKRDATWGDSLHVRSLKDLMRKE